MVLDVRVVINNHGDGYTVVVDEFGNPGETVGEAAADTAASLAQKVADAPIHRVAVIVRDMGETECKVAFDEFLDDGHKIKAHLVDAVRTMATQATGMLINLAL